MALANRLAMRQGQAMVLTPQLLQAIKLLQMPNAELAAFIEAELERNPLLERADELPSFDPPAAGGETAPEAAAPEPGDWATESLESDPRRWRAISAPKSTTPSSSTAADAGRTGAHRRGPGPVGDLVERNRRARLRRRGAPTLRPMSPRRQAFPNT